MFYPDIPHQRKRSAGNLVGVGLRSPHHHDALQDVSSETSFLDFVEVHSENFFAEGGHAPRFIQSIAQKYPLSLHGTSMGLGSEAGVKQAYLDRLQRLIELTNPIFVSDHASFSWATVQGQMVHAGDLLPIPFDPHSLTVLASNVDAVQQRLGRQLFVENIVSYLPCADQTMSETEFLVSLAERTGCGLLIDINNLLVNAMNFSNKDPIQVAKNWLSDIPRRLIGEIHLAGFTPVTDGELIVDDHSQPVSDAGWELYAYTIGVHGPIPTLIEWDNDLPSWQGLLQEARKAKTILNQHDTQAVEDKLAQHQLGATDAA